MPDQPTQPKDGDNKAPPDNPSWKPDTADITEAAVKLQAVMRGIPQRKALKNKRALNAIRKLNQQEQLKQVNQRKQLNEEQLNQEQLKSEQQQRDQRQRKQQQREQRAATYMQLAYHRSTMYAKLRQREYFEVEGLLHSISSGAIAPMRGSYLIEMAERGERLHCRQDTPHRAFWRSSELLVLLDGLKAKFGKEEATRRFTKLFVSVSYRWISPSVSWALSKLAK